MLVRRYFSLLRFASGRYQGGVRRLAVADSRPYGRNVTVGARYRHVTAMLPTVGVRGRNATYVERRKSPQRGVLWKPACSRGHVEMANR